MKGLWGKSGQGAKTLSDGEAGKLAPLGQRTLAPLFLSGAGDSAAGDHPGARRWASSKKRS